MIRGFCVSVFVLIWAHIFAAAVASPAEPLLRGVLALAHRGRVTGAERFALTETGNGYRLSSEGRFTTREGETTWKAQALFSPELVPLEYELEKRTPRTSMAIRAIWSATRQEFSVELYRGGVRVADLSFRGRDWILLDEDVVSHYVVLALRLWLGKGTEFTALIPQARLAVPLKAEPTGLAAFTAPWGNEVARRWLLSLGGEEVLLYEHAGEFLWAEVPKASLAAWRADLFRALPSPFRIQAERTPFPDGAREERVRFFSDGIELAGTLLFPAGGGPFPAVLFIPGTGRMDRDGSAPGKPAALFRELAYSLAETGIASLRYDKRGVGESKGDLSRASVSDLLSDARAALEFLGSRPEVQSVFLIGHSEGALLAPLLAHEAGVAGLILLGAPARPLRDVLPWQLEQALRAAGAPEERISRELTKLAEFLAFVAGSSGDWGDYTPEALREALPHYSPEEIEGMKGTSLRWWREELVHDPAVAIRGISVPFLVLNGGADIRVPPGDAPALAEVARAAGNPDATGIVVPKMNHWLRFQPGRPLPELISGPLDPRAVQSILDWLSKHARG